MASGVNFPEALLEQLRRAGKIVAVTGAGISAESGLATFRDAQTGLWSKFRPEELATAEAFQRDPGFVQGWYAWRRANALKAKPNAGHFALVEIERRAPEFLLVTQNVDGLHQRAGSKEMVELHGNIHRFRCFENDCRGDNFDVENGRCLSCGGHLRPAVVWFGETLPVDALQTAVAAAEACDAFLSIGTSSLVYPAADLWRRARDNGAVVIEINKDPTPLTPLAHYSLLGKAGEILPALVRQIWIHDQRGSD
jgi:NAD-dependent deacetylase